MFHIPTFNGSLAHWVVLVFLASSPLLFIGEATGWTSFGYSKFADRDKGAALPSRVGMFLIYFPAAVLVWVPLLVREVELSTWHLLVATLVSLHFGKRCLEVLFLHRYSGVMNLGSIVMICGMYSAQALILGEVAATAVGEGGMATTGFETWMIVGLVLWVIGTGLNFQHHRLLANLRKPGETEYKVPSGGLFGLVACPHYLAELIGWWGYALIFHHIAGVMLWVVMAMYLAGRAHATLRWYRERLGDRVPANWKRLVPFIY